MYDFFKWDQSQSRLEQAASDLGRPHLKLTYDVATRWLSHYKVFSCAFRSLPAALLAADRAAVGAQAYPTVTARDSAQTVLTSMCNPAFFVGLILGMLLLEPLQRLVKCLQSRSMCSFSAHAEVERAKSCLTESFISEETAFVGALFADLTALMSFKDAMSNGLSLREDEDGDVCLCIGDHSWPVVSKPVTGKKTPREMSRSDFESTVFLVKEAFVEEALTLRIGLDTRLPMLQSVAATRFVFPKTIVSTGAVQIGIEWAEMLPALRARYAIRMLKDKVITPVVDVEKLNAQFVDYLQLAVPIAAQAIAEPEPELLKKSDSVVEPVTRFWRRMSTVDGKESIDEWFRFARAVLVEPIGSVEDERNMSAMSALKTVKRNRLNNEHLELCMRVYLQRFYSVKTLPVNEVLAEWWKSPRRF
jgi:hypothetical protein